MVFSIFVLGMGLASTHRYVQQQDLHQVLKLSKLISILVNEENY